MLLLAALVWAAGCTKSAEPAQEDRAAEAEAAAEERETAQAEDAEADGEQADAAEPEADAGEEHAEAADAEAEAEAGEEQALRIDGEKARALVEAGAFLLDVRTPEEFAEGHVEGATNIPVDALAERLADVPKDHDVVVYCRSGGRSARAASLLREAGYQVHDLGGMDAWTTAAAEE